MTSEDERKRNKEIFEELDVKTSVMKMAMPMIASQLMVLIYNIADIFFIGRTNNPNMIAGASLILPLFNVCIAVSNISGTGGGTLIPRMLGLKKENEARKISAFSFYFAMLTSALLSVFMLIFMDGILRFIGASDETYTYAKQYAMCVIVFGAIPTIMTSVLCSLVRNSGNSKIAGLGATMGGIINIFLDPLFMFVILPEGNETLGAGIATALSNMITCVFFIIYILKSKSAILNFSIKQGMPSVQNIKLFFTVGIPAAISMLLFDLDYIVLDKLMASYSDTALAALGIVLKAERLPLNVGIGLGLGMSPIVAYNYSSQNFDRMKKSVTCTRRIGIAVAVTSIICYELFAPAILKFFIEDQMTIQLGSRFLRARTIATLFMFLSFIYLYYFQAIGRGNVSLLLVVMRWVVLNIPMLFIFNRIFGMYGLVWSQLVSDFINAALTYLIYRRFNAKRLVSEHIHNI